MKFKIIVFVLITTFTFLIYFFQRQSIQIRKYSNRKVFPNNSRSILYWMKMFDAEDFYLGFGRKIFANCPVTNCFTTNNKNEMPIENFDAIIFHGPEYKVWSYGTPAKRKSSQFYIYGSMESPIYTSSALKYNQGFFNWTMTYR